MDMSASQMKMKYCSSFTWPSSTRLQYFTLCARNEFGSSPAVDIPIISLFVYAFMASLNRLYCFGFLNAWISSAIAILQLNESCASGFVASALKSNSPPPISPEIECSLLLSMMRRSSPSPMFMMLYFMNPKVSIVCFSAAATTYIFVPDMRYRMPSP